MSITMRRLCACLFAITAVILSGCEEEQSAAGAATSKSTPSAAPMPPPAHSAVAPAPSAMAVEPKHDCPEGSTGEGSSVHPCEAKGAQRLMQVAWTHKISDAGPMFRVTNKSKLVILYGKLYVYFYDKKGKQLDVQADDSSKTRPYKTCSGRIFGGVMNVGEKAVLTFSCVKKQTVPEGTALIEGEMQTVGFADSSGKKVDFYWHNRDLVPAVRPKGGVKK